MKMPMRYFSMGGAFALIGVALFYLAQKSIFSADPEVDFKYLWFAGELWNAGINPYSEAFSQEGAKVFTNTNALNSWLYPPNWWAISAFLALFDFAEATWLWRTLNATFIIVGSFLLFRALKLARPKTPLWAGALIFFFAVTFQATPMTLAMGQTSILIFFGVCCLTYGLSLKRPAFEILGLVLLMFKPHIGIIAFFALFVLPQHRRNVLIAGTITGVLCVPALFIAGIGPTVFGFLEQLTTYSALEVNSPVNSTGLGHLVFELLSLKLPTIPLVFAGGIAAAGIVLFLHRSQKTPRGTPEFYIYVMSAIILMAITVAPLHSYDLIISVPLIVLFFIHPKNIALAFLCLGYVLLYRAGNLAKITGFYDEAVLFNIGSHLESLAGAMMLAVFIYSVSGAIFLERLMARKP
ncbi:MAG: hypothetical protein DHS20C05_14870 [Hyphococcus sp.]|nr:MAG: hypothetical protein DHS20C05_14870 [Marinicaulis sp.]